MRVPGHTVSPLQLQMHAYTHIPKIGINLHSISVLHVAAEAYLKEQIMCFDAF